MEANNLICGITLKTSHGIILFINLFDKDSAY